MTDPFAIFRDKRSAAIAATILSVLLLLPASLGLGGTIVEEAFGQFDLPSLLGEEEPEEVPTSPPEEEEETTPPPEEDTTSPPEEDTTPPPEEDTTPPPEEEITPIPPQGTENGLTFLERGFIGSSLPTQGGSEENTHAVAGRWRIFANESLVHRFVADMNLAAIDGTTSHNITIEETAPHRFEVTESGNGTATTTTTGSIPPVSSELRTRIYVNSNTPIIDNVPMTISIRGQVLAIEGIDIDETRITDAGQRNILSVIDGQSIYGTVDEAS
jgi:hypothetical protein